MTASQAIQPSGVGRREGVRQRAKEGRRKHTLLSLQEEEKYAGGLVEGEMCSDNWNTSHHRAIITGTHQLDKCISNSWEDQHKVCYKSCFDHNVLTPMSRYCAILLIQMIVLVRMAVCVKQDTGTQNNIGGVQQGYYCPTVNNTYF